MKGFYPGMVAYDIAETIYEEVGGDTFTLAALHQAGHTRITSGNLTRLRNAAVLMHPTEARADGTNRPRIRQHQHGPKTWVLSPAAVKRIEARKRKGEAV